MDRQLDYMRIGEAASYLGISPGTLRNWERSGKLTTFRHPLNNYRLYRRHDLDEILRQIEVSGLRATWRGSSASDEQSANQGDRA